MSVKISVVRSAAVCSLALLLTACSHSDPTPAPPPPPSAPRPLVLPAAAEADIKAIQSAPNLTDQQKQEAIAHVQATAAPAHP